MYLTIPINWNNFLCLFQILFLLTHSTLFSLVFPLKFSQTEAPYLMMYALQNLILIFSQTPSIYYFLSFFILCSSFIQMLNLSWKKNLNLGRESDWEAGEVEPLVKEIEMGNWKIFYQTDSLKYLFLGTCPQPFRESADEKGNHSETVSWVKSCYYADGNDKLGKM